ncbi:MobC family plasmid mobilization relaxosome protein [uncultured Williamsia sp.]|uniref:MobC family plasmid mobilization relaxosome protein n=1 Tax=uncultured Williamsia sp. TaxID=259311 RepID=UPI002608E755|nr:MobC family plasmid mobilization relaxosome protein [uncultured Williamsia sp.]
MAFRRERQTNVVGGRTGRFNVKTSPEQTAALMALAAERGMTVPRLLVSSTLRPSVMSGLRRDDVTDLLGVMTYLGAISNNVNQLAKVANATNELPAETAQTLARVREVAGRLQLALDRLEGSA